MRHIRHLRSDLLIFTDARRPVGGMRTSRNSPTICGSLGPRSPPKKLSASCHCGRGIRSGGAAMAAPPLRTPLLHQFPFGRLRSLEKSNFLSLVVLPFQASWHKHRLFVQGHLKGINPSPFGRGKNLLQSLGQLRWQLRQPRSINQANGNQVINMN